MDTFTIQIRCHWLIAALGRNPLVRISDRIEVWSFVAAALIIAVATPFVCALETSLQDSRARSYAEEALHRHTVTATSIEEGDLLVIAPSDISYTARAQWDAPGGRQAGIVNWPDRAKVGDQERIWVDDDGLYTRPPRSPGRAATDARVIALTGWFGVVIVVAGSLYAIRRRLDTRRFAQWDLEVNGLLEGGDHKKSQ